MSNRVFRIWNSHYTNVGWHTHEGSWWELPVNNDNIFYNTTSSAAEMASAWNQCCISADDLRAAFERSSQHTQDSLVEFGLSISDNQKAISFSPDRLEELL